ncbi:unnamed protein product, partial [Cylicocyclus nassatus]
VGKDGVPLPADQQGQGLNEDEINNIVTERVRTRVNEMKETQDYKDFLRHKHGLKGGSTSYQDFVDNDNITIKMPNKVGLMQSESLFGYLNRKFCYTHLNKKGEVIRNSKGNVCYVHTKRYINARYNNYEKNIDKIVLAYRKALNWFVTTLNAEVGLTDDDLRKIAYYNYTYRFRLLSYEQFNKLTYEPQADDLMFNLDSILMLDKKEQFVQGVYLPFTSFFTEHEYYATMLDSVLERYQFVGDSERYVKYENVKRARQRLAGLSVVHY